MWGELLTRDDFRVRVFTRDGHRCVICGAEGKDAHHIMERRLFDNGGYSLDNGATLCENHHVRARQRGKVGSEGHAQTSHHWQRQKIAKNKLKEP